MPRAEALPRVRRLGHERYHPPPRIARGARASRARKTEEIVMAFYVDAFVSPVPKKNMEAYRKVAKKAGKIWLEYGALEYVETEADDAPVGKKTSFPRAVKLEDDEIVCFAYVVYKNRKHRDAVMKKVMADPRLHAPEMMPFDGSRLIFGGFKPFVAVKQKA
jgi:uncharacterized protein YbaA (DUF1428 family)